VWFQNVSIPTQRRGIGNSKGEGVGVGGLKSLFLNRRVNESKLEKVEGGVPNKKKTSVGGLWFFWNTCNDHFYT